MVRTSLPPGFRFHPSDVELVKYYLTRKVLGKRFPIDAIAEVDIYRFAPWDLRGKACSITKDLKWYFFCPRERKYSTGGRTNRSTDFGFWKTTGKDRPVIYKGQSVGMIKSLIFHRRGREPKPERTNWVMHEYRLEDEDLKTKGVAQDAFVICMIFEKDGPGPRNGAQYGAPFNEGEWDDDEEADVPSTSSFTQASILPDKQKQTVDIRITGSEQYCGGSTSKACPAGPSQIVPSVVNMPPPALPNDVTMEDPENEYLLSHGIFGDEILAASSENDKVESLDHINPDGNNQADYTVDDIFDGLEACVELKDLDAPLTSVNGPDPSGHNHSDSCLSAYDHSIAAQRFWTPGVPYDTNAPGLGLKDLEIPLTATQSNQAYLDASFYDLGGNDVLGGFGTSDPPVFAQPFHGLEVTHIAEDFPWGSQCLQWEPFEGYVDNCQEGYGVEERTNLEIGAATSPINNLDLGCARACENSGRGRSQLW